MAKKRSAKDVQAVDAIKKYGWGAMGTMVAVPIPGADIAATTAVWGTMIFHIADVYGYETSMEDAKRLASDLFKSVILTTAAWFASAKAASFFLKFIPGAGTATAYIIDALVAGIGARGITNRLGAAAAAYYKSGKKLAPETLAEHVKNVAGDPNTILKALSLITTGTTIDGADDIADLAGSSDLDEI